MEESLRAQRLKGTQNDVLYGAQPPPTECDFEGPHSKISAMGPEFLATALRTIISLFHTAIVNPNPTEEFFSIWRWKVHNRPHKQVPLLQAIDDVCNDQCQACICHARLLFFPKCLTNENLWPNPQTGLIKKSAMRNTPADIFL